MNRRYAAFASVALLVLIVIAAAVYLKLKPSQQLQNASQAPVDSALAVGEAAPEFTTPSTAGTFDLDAQTKPVLLEIFATWCPHCQRETAVLDKLYAAYGSRVAFLAVPGSDTGMDETSPESPFDVINFQTRFNVKYPLAAYDPALTVAKEYLLGGYPTIVVIARDKKIASITSGEVAYNDLASALNSVLAH